MKSGASISSRRAGRRAAALLARFAAAERGATAVEFSLIALPFFTLLFAVLELGLVFMVSTNLENATDLAARKIRTGEAQTAGTTAAAFKTAICSHMVVSDCATNLKVDVRTFTQFADVSASNPLTNGKFDDTKMKYQPGGPEQIVMVRAYYQWTLITPMLNTALQSLANGKRLISATATFQNEPYET